MLDYKDSRGVDGENFIGGRLGLNNIMKLYSSQFI